MFNALAWLASLATVASCVPFCNNADITSSILTCMYYAEGTFLADGLNVNQCFESHVCKNADEPGAKPAAVMADDNSAYLDKYLLGIEQQKSVYFTIIRSFETLKRQLSLTGLLELFVGLYEELLNVRDSDIKCMVMTFLQSDKCSDITDISSRDVEFIKATLERLINEFVKTVRNKISTVQNCGNYTNLAKCLYEKGQNFLHSSFKHSDMLEECIFGMHPNCVRQFTVFSTNIGECFFDLNNQQRLSIYEAAFVAQQCHINIPRMTQLLDKTVTTIGDEVNYYCDNTNGADPVICFHKQTGVMDDINIILSDLI